MRPAAATTTASSPRAKPSSDKHSHTIGPPRKGEALSCRQSRHASIETHFVGLSIESTRAIARGVTLRAAAFGRREGSLCSPYGVFEAAKLPQKQIMILIRRSAASSARLYQQSAASPVRGGLLFAVGANDTKFASFTLIKRKVRAAQRRSCRRGAQRPRGFAFEKEEQRSERALPLAVGANDMKLATTPRRRGPCFGTPILV